MVRQKRVSTEYIHGQHRCINLGGGKGSGDWIETEDDSVEVAAGLCLLLVALIARLLAIFSRM